MSEPQWLTVARKYLGLAEGPDAADNPKVVAFYARAGHPEVKHDAVPWCAAFVGAVLAEAGLKGTGTLWALDYARWGKGLAAPAVGAVATKKRNGGGHVFFVAGFTPTHVLALGGNQGDRVSVTRIPRRLVNAYRWPAEASAPAPDFRNHSAARAENTGGKES